jgi:hypothetical protein
VTLKGDAATPLGNFQVHIYLRRCSVSRAPLSDYSSPPESGRTIHFCSQSRTLTQIKSALNSDLVCSSPLAAKRSWLTKPRSALPDNSQCSQRPHGPGNWITGPIRLFAMLGAQPWNPTVELALPIIGICGIQHTPSHVSDSEDDAMPIKARKPRPSRNLERFGRAITKPVIVLASALLILVVNKYVVDHRIRARPPDQRSSIGCQYPVLATLERLMVPTPLEFFLSLLTAATLLRTYVYLNRDDRHQTWFLLGASATWLLMSLSSGQDLLLSGVSTLPWIMLAAVVVSDAVHYAMRSAHCWQEQFCDT